MKGLWIWVILAIAVAARVSLLTRVWDDPHRALTPDSYGYLHLADTIREQSAFADHDGNPEIFRTPGYPAFVMVGSWTGWITFDSDVWLTWRPVLHIQVVLDCILVLLTYSFGKTLLGRRAGLLAAFFQAVSPMAIASSCRILSDSLYALLLTVALMLLVRHFRDGGWRSLIASAVVLGAACYVRPVGLVMAGVFVLVLLFRPKRFQRAGAFAGVVLACIAPWVVRNAVVADYVGFSSFATDSMFVYSAPQALARAEGISELEAGQMLVDRGNERLAAEAAITPAALARLRRREVVRVIFEHPGTFAWLHIRGCAGFWLPGATDVLEVAGVTKGQRGTLAVLQTDGLVAAARHYFGGDATAILLAIPMVGLLALKYVGVAACLVKRLRPRMSSAAWLMMLIVSVSAILGGPASTPRFRVPVAPLLSIAAAAGCLAVGDFLRRRMSRRRVPPSTGAKRRLWVPDATRALSTHKLRSTSFRSA